MRLKEVAVLLAMPLCACVSSANNANNNGPTAESTTVAVLATPALFLIKAPVCIGILPAIGLAAAANAWVAPDSPQDLRGHEFGRYLIENDLRQDCGPPWVVSP